MDPLLVIHNGLRWLVLVTALYAIVRGVMGWRGGAQWSPADCQAGQWFAYTLTIQVFVGFALMAAPGTLASRALESGVNIMRTPQLRYFVLEHPVLMLLATGVAHFAASSSAKRESHRLLALGVAAALIVIVAAVPWPGGPYPRPLFRLG